MVSYEEVELYARLAYDTAKAILPPDWGLIVVVGPYGRGERVPTSTYSEVRQDLAAIALRHAAEVLERGEAVSLHPLKPQ